MPYGNEKTETMLKIWVMCNQMLKILQIHRQNNIILKSRSFLRKIQIISLLIIYWSNIYACVCISDKLTITHIRMITKLNEYLLSDGQEKDLIRI